MQKNTRNMASPDACDPEFFMAKAPGSAGAAQLSLLNLIETVFNGELLGQPRPQAADLEPAADPMNAFFPKKRVKKELETNFSGEILMLIKKEVSER